MAQQQSNEEILIHGLMNDITGGDITISKDELAETISNILKKYNLSTDMSFIEKIATMTFPDSNEKLSIDMLPKEFTISSLRKLYCLLFDRDYDVRNFYKKMLQMDYILPLEKKQVGVSHRAARYFRFVSGSKRVRKE